VKFKIEGEGIIAGVGNGNAVSHESFKADSRKAFHGLCQAIVQSKRERGAIRLSAESEGLQRDEVVIQAK
jgi:beta-galactosidase